MTTGIPGILLVDIDHTISDAAWRDHLMGDWAKYHAASALDKPILEVIAIVRALQAAGWYTIGFTMRPDRWRTLSITWMGRQGLKLHEMLMRMPDVWEPSVVGKCKLLDERFKDHDFEKVPVVLLDDHPEVCHVIAKRNITVLQVHARKGRKTHGKENDAAIQQAPAQATADNAGGSGG